MNLIKNLSNIPGWHQKKRIVVIDSDDWGSIRMPSNEVRKALINGNVLTTNRNNPYYLYDSLECNEDLSFLFETLSSFKDYKGNHPVFTAVNVLANPDFEKIKEANFSEYFYEPFTETLKRYPNHDQVYNLWKEGCQKRLFVPQFHGREHLNVTAWMKALKAGMPKTRFAFDLGVSGINPVLFGESNIQFQAAFDIEELSELGYLKSVIIEGAGMFEQLLGYKASYFVPSNGPFNLTLESTLKEVGIRYLMLDKIQKEPIGNGKHKTHFRWLGKTNRFGQISLSRNASFEPSLHGHHSVASCLKDIETAFRWGKPATISTHRVNYIGFLDERNRTNNLRLLKELLTEILKRWPDVEFLTSTEIGDLIKEHK